MKYKKCSICKEVKILEQFNKNNRTKDGLTSACKACRANARFLAKDKIKKKKDAWYAANKEAVSEKAKLYRKENPDIVKEKEARNYIRNREKKLLSSSIYSKNNPEVVRKAGKKYRKATPDKQAAKAARRRALLKKASPPWSYDEFEQLYIQEIYHLSQLHRELTKVEFHVDHIVPLTSKFVCGLHCASNLRLLTSLENIVKHNRYWPDMW